MKRATMGTLVRLGTRAGAIAVCAILAGGCDNNHLLGAVDGGPSGSGDAGPPPGMDANPDLVRPNLTTEIWAGYIENFQFMSGSDAVKITFMSDAVGNLTGIVTLGNGTPPPPATDPNVGYPPGYTGPISRGAGPPYVAEGFSYTMRDGTLAGQRLRFAVSLYELWQGWCALQTPPPDGSPFCLASKGGFVSADRMTCENTNPLTGQNEPIDCGKFSLCALDPVCGCSASSCTPLDGNQVQFDLSINNSLGDGSIAGALGDHNVHLTWNP